MAQINLPTKQKQTHRHREEACGCHGGGEWGREGLEVWDEQTKPDMDKQQGLTGQHRELYSISCDKPSWKRIPF